MHKQDGKRNNNEEANQLPEAKKPNIEDGKPKGNLNEFVVKTFDCFKSAVFLQIIEEVIEKTEQE